MMGTSMLRARTHSTSRLTAAAASLVALSLLAVGAGPALAATGGDRDRSFGHQGVVRTDVGGVDVANDVAVQPDGRIVVVGTSDGDVAVARYTRNGKLDRTFSGDGKVVTDLGGATDSGRAVALDADGNIVVVGGANTLACCNGVRDQEAVVRYTPSGRVDRTFATNGVFTSGTVGTANDVLVQANGKIVLIGLHLLRLKHTGVLDPKFKQPEDFAEGSRFVVRQANGSYVLAAGTDDAATVLTRFTPDGVLDDTFRRRSLEGGALGESPVGLSIVAGGNILAVSSGVYYGADYVPGRGDDEDRDESAPAITFERYLPNGHRDHSFGVGGERVQELRRFPAGLDTPPTAATVTPDGKILVVSSTYVARFRPGGKLDRSFGGDGIVPLRGLGAATSVALQPDSKVLVAGQTGDDLTVQRLLGR